MSLWRHCKAILILPVTVTVIIPTVMLSLSGNVRFGWGFPYPYWLFPAILGCVLIGSGLALLVTTIIQFARIGAGTLAPWDPTQKLVVQGVYCHVRNPMISGIILILIGETVLFGSWLLLGWCLLFVIANAVYIPLCEERGLTERFGETYRVYKQHVPRWIPRVTSWKPTSDITQ
jgi:protein-S-isoprenylcysteine O-methyltransferase Ste14